MRDQDKSKQELLEELARLRQQEARWRSVIANTPVFVALVDRAGVIQFLNHAQPGMSVEEAIGKSTYDFLDPQYHEVVREHLRHVFQTGEARFFKSAGAGPNGQDAAYETYLGPVTMDGQVVAATMTAIDVTQRKKTEEALRKAHDELEKRVEERTVQLSRANEDLDIFRKFIEASGRGFGMADLTGTVTYVNPTMCRMLGEDRPEEVLGKHFSAYCPAEHRQLVEQEILPVVLAQGQWNGESAVLTRQGHVFPTLESAFLVRDEAGQPVRLALAVADITDRKQAEEALRQSNDQLLAIYDGIVEGLLITDIATKRFVRVNAAFCRMLGYSEGELLAASLQDIHPPEEVPNDLRRFQAAAEGRVSINEERPVLRKDGSLFYADITGHPILYEGRPCLLALFRDITERREAQEALRQAHDELQAIYDGMVDGLLIADVETKQFIRANVAICRMLGYPMDELLSKSVADIHPAKDLPRIVARFHSQAAGRTGVNENAPVLRKDGSLFYADIASNPIIYNGRPCLIGFFRDITQRKQSDEALRQSQATLDAFFNASTAILNIVDDEFRYIKTDGLTPSYFGLDARNIVGQSLRDLAPGFVAEYGAMIQRVIETGDAVHDVEVKTALPSRSGALAHWRASYFAVPLPEGRRGYGVVGVEITDMKRAEDALRKEQRTLKHLLESSDHERQTIAYEIHDGLAQYLAGAIMQFQTFDAMKDAKPKQAAEAYEAGLTMLRQGHFEARRLIAGVRPPILDESGVVAAVGHLVNEQSHRKGPKIDYHSRVDFDRLHPLLENAIYRIAQEGLANACRHSQSAKVRLSLLQQEDRVRVEIRDWGTGFDTKTVVGERFGLEGMRQRARLLGGKCSIYSAPGKGTRVTVELPVVLRD